MFYLVGWFLRHIASPQLGFPRSSLFQEKRQLLAFRGFGKFHHEPRKSLPPHWIQQPGINVKSASVKKTRQKLARNMNFILIMIAVDGNTMETLKLAFPKNSLCPNPNLTSVDNHNLTCIQQMCKNCCNRKDCPGLLFTVCS